MARSRWPALDGLRGVAIVLVIAAHFGLGGTGGMVGVTLFFVLSGFLITHLLLDERMSTGRIDLKAFYGRRALRLLPALGFYLIGIGFLAWLLRLAVPIWEMTWPPALYAANYVQVAGVDLYAHRHTWSLAVEEHFYLIWPVLVIWGATTRIRVFALAIVGLVLWRLAVGMTSPVWAYMATDTNAYALGVGCLLATIRHRGIQLRLPPRAAEFGVGALVFLSLVPFDSWEHLYQIAVWLPVVAATVSALVIWGSIESIPAFLSGRTLGWIGGISYSLYLWHAPLFMFPMFSGPEGRLAALTVAVGLAALSWYLIEGPIARSRLRRRLATRETSALAMETSA